MTINQDVTLTYTSTTGNALSNAFPATTTFNITVSAGKNLTVSNAKIDLAGATLTLKSNASGTASLIQKEVVNATASNLIVERYISAWTDDSHGWHLISSPVAAQAVAPNFTDPTPGNYDFYQWDEVTNTWLNQKVGANNITNFGPGTGYLVAYANAGTRQFTGALNNANVTATGLTISGGANSGWNLVGNPFASAIKWNDGTNWTVPAEIGGIAKVWNEPTAAYVDIAANGIIPAMNGFMVHVESGSPASLIIPTAARVHDATPWYKSTEGALKLIAYDRTGNTAQEFTVGANPLATDGFDAAFDSRFLAGYAPMFYATSAGEYLSTCALPSITENTTIELGFVKNAGTEFSIGLAQGSSIPGMTPWLTDKKTGAVTEMKDNVEYSFQSAEGDDANRFLLHFGPLGIDDPQASSSFSAYAHDGIIYILSDLDEQADVIVTNLLGQEVMRAKASANSLTTLSAASLRNGIYLVSLAGRNFKASEKVMIAR
jgi:hypothetical protein